MDYYKILDVSKDASVDEIKKAYKILVAKKHPDKFGNTQESEEEFRNIKKAYETLSDTNKRELYNKYGSDWENKSRNSGFGSGFTGDFSNWGSDLFSSIFDGFGGRRNATIKGDDIEVIIKASILDVANGIDKSINYKRVIICKDCKGSGAKNKESIVSCSYCHGMGQIQQNLGGMIFASTCGACNGKGKSIKLKCSYCAGYGSVQISETLNVSIPIGMPFNKSIKKQGFGSEVLNGITGDLYIKVVEEILSKVLYKRLDNDKDLVLDLNINFVEAILGCVKEVPSIIKGESNIQINIKEGIDNDNIVIIKNKGVPILNQSGRRGDLLVHIKISTPKNLTQKQKELIEEFGKDTNYLNSDKKSNWFSFF